jgi:MFS family permease
MASVYDQGAGATAGGTIRKLLLPLYLPCWFDSVSMGIIGPVLPLFVLSLGASEALAGLVVSTVAAGRLSFSVPGGQLVGRIGEKRAIQLGLLVYMLSSLLLALAPSVPFVMLARLLAGAGQQSCGVGRQAFCAAAVATHHRGRIVGLLGGVSRIGGIAGPLIGGYTAQVRKTPSWPRSWVNFSRLLLYSHRNAWANILTSFGPTQHLSRPRPSASARPSCCRPRSTSPGCCSCRPSARAANSRGSHLGPLGTTFRTPGTLSGLTKTH